MRKILRGVMVLMLAAAMTVGLCGAAATAAGSVRTAMIADKGVSVKTFGAKGDGQTDDTKALEDAFKDACADGAASLYFPAGTYVIAGRLTVPAEAELCFDEGAVLQLDKSAVLTYNGSLTAGQTTVFAGEGTVKWNAVTAVGDPHWFGAKGDGVTDDTAAFQKTMDLFRDIAIPYSEAGYVVGDLKLTRTYTTFHGESADRKAKLIASSSAKNMISVSASNVDVAFLSFEMAAAPTATCLFYDDTKVGMELCNARYIDANDAYCVLRDADHATNLIVTSKFENFHCVNGRGTAISVADMWGFIFMTDMVIDYSGSAARHGITVDFPGFRMRDNAGAILRNIQLIGDPNGTKESHGFHCTSSAAVWMREFDVQNWSGNGINISTSWAYLVHSKIKNCLSTGVDAQNCFTLQVVDVDVAFNDQVKDKADGVCFRGGSHNQLSNVTVNRCGHYGVQDKGTGTAITLISGDNNADGLMHQSKEE